MKTSTWMGSNPPLLFGLLAAQNSGGNLSAQAADNHSPELTACKVG